MSNTTSGPDGFRFISSSAQKNGVILAQISLPPTYSIRGIMEFIKQEFEYDANPADINIVQDTTDEGQSVNTAIVMIREMTEAVKEQSTAMFLPSARRTSWPSVISKLIFLLLLGGLIFGAVQYMKGGEFHFTPTFIPLNMPVPDSFEPQQEL